MWTTEEIQVKIREVLSHLEDIQEYCYEHNYDVELYHTIDDLEELDVQLGRPTV